MVSYRIVYENARLILWLVCFEQIEDKVERKNSYREFRGHGEEINNKPKERFSTVTKINFQALTE